MHVAYNCPEAVSKQEMRPCSTSFMLQVVSVLTEDHVMLGSNRISELYNYTFLMEECRTAIGTCLNHET